MAEDSKHVREDKNKLDGLSGELAVVPETLADEKQPAPTKKELRKVNKELGNVLKSAKNEYDAKKALYVSSRKAANTRAIASNSDKNTVNLHLRGYLHAGSTFVVSAIPTLASINIGLVRPNDVAKATGRYFTPEKNRAGKLGQSRSGFDGWLHYWPELFKKSFPQSTKENPIGISSRIAGVIAFALGFINGIVKTVDVSFKWYSRIIGLYSRYKKEGSIPNGALNYEKETIEYLSKSGLFKMTFFLWRILNITTIGPIKMIGDTVSTILDSLSQIICGSVEYIGAKLTGAGYTLSGLIGFREDRIVQENRQILMSSKLSAIFYGCSRIMPHLVTVTIFTLVFTLTALNPVVAFGISFAASLSFAGLSTFIIDYIRSSRKTGTPPKSRLDENYKDKFGNNHKEKRLALTAFALTFVVGLFFVTSLFMGPVVSGITSGLASLIMSAFAGGTFAALSIGATGAIGVLLAIALVGVYAWVSQSFSVDMGLEISDAHRSTAASENQAEAEYRGAAEKYLQALENHHHVKEAYKNHKELVRPMNQDHGQSEGLNDSKKVDVSSAISEASVTQFSGTLAKVEDSRGYKSVVAELKNRVKIIDDAIQHDAPEGAEGRDNSFLEKESGIELAPMGSAVIKEAKVSDLKTSPLSLPSPVLGSGSVGFFPPAVEIAPATETTRRKSSNDGEGLTKQTPAIN